MVHHATSSPPDIDRLIEETRQTTFTNRIAYARLRDVAKLKFPEYARNTDPRAHLRAFRLVVTRAYLIEEESEAGFYHFFAENLVGPDLEWFASLEKNSIEKFNKIALAFLK